jgi:hypothetical protein
MERGTERPSLRIWFRDEVRFTIQLLRRFERPLRIPVAITEAQPLPAVSCRAVAPMPQTLCLRRRPAR